MGNERSILRNPLIANTLYLTSDIERWGSGLKRIHDACVEANVKVTFENLKTGFLVTFYRPRVSDIGEKTREKVREKTREKILRLIRENPHITTLELAKKSEITPKGIEWNIRKLKTKGVLKRIGPDKGGYWKIVE